ncbi:MAG TPA: hypothetical protein VN652_07680 [Geobacteraceae bacterium]|nr:hypothetical protein [Geobacteraceae bacterium]
MSSTKTKLLDSAQKNLLKGQYGRAVSDYRQIIQLEPSDMRHRQKLAEILTKANLKDEAITEYTSLAKHYIESVHYLKAIAVYKQVQKLDPTNPEISLTLASLNEKQGLIGNATAEYASALQLFEKNSENLKALKVLESMLALDPGNSAVRLRIAEKYFVVGKEGISFDQFLALATDLKSRDDENGFKHVSEKIRQLFKERAQELFSKIEGEKEIEVPAPVTPIPDKTVSEPVKVEAKPLQAALPAKKKQADAVIEVHPEPSPAASSIAPEAPAVDIPLIEELEEIDELEEFSATTDEPDWEEDIELDLDLAHTGPPTVDDFIQDVEECEESGPVFELDEPDLEDIELELELGNEELELGNKELELNDEELELDDEELELDNEELELGNEELELGDEELELDNEELELNYEELELGNEEFELGNEEFELGNEELELDNEELELDNEELELDNEELELGNEELELGNEELELNNEELELNDEEIELNDEEIELNDEELELNDEELEPNNEEPAPDNEEPAPDEKVLGLDELDDSTPLPGPDGISHPESGISETTFDLAGELSMFADEIDFDLIRTAASDSQFTLDTASGFKRNELDNEDAESHYSLGLAYKEMGLFDEAISEFLVASRSEERKIDSLILTAVCFRELGKTEMAVEILSDTVKLPDIKDDELLGVKYELAICRETLGEMLLARQLYTEIMTVRPDFSDTANRIDLLQHS